MILFQFNQPSYYNSQFACLFVPVTTPRLLGLKGSNFQGLMRVILGTLQRSLVNIGLFANSYQTIGPKGLKYTGFNEGHPGVVLRKFGEDRSKTLPMRLFFPPKNSWSWSQLYAWVNHPTFYSCVNTYTSKSVPNPLSTIFFFFFFTSF